MPALISSSTTGNQWFIIIDEQFVAIDGANSQIFIPEFDIGNYVVEVRINGCNTFSEISELVITSINKDSSSNEIIVFPNPSIGFVTFTLPAFLTKTIDRLRLLIFDNMVRLVVQESFEINNSDVLINMKNNKKGLYTYIIVDKAMKQILTGKLVLH